MSTSKRVLVALTMLAIAATLAFVPGLGTSASAASAQCASARSMLSSAQQSHAKAKKKVVKKKKVLKKAKKAHHKATVKKVKVKKAKKQLKKAKRQLRAANARVASHATTASRVCAVAFVPGSPAALGKEMDVLQVALGGDLLQTLTPQQLLAMLDALFPGVSGLLDPSTLLGLLDGFNSGGLPTPDELSRLLGGALDVSRLQALLGGTADDALVKSFAETIMGQLGALGGGLSLPAGGFDPANLSTLIAGLTGALDPAQLGGLLSMLKDGLGMSGTLDLSELTTLLDGLVPGLSGSFTSGQLGTMLGAANGSVPGVGRLSNLLGGFFTLDQLQSVLGGTAGDSLLGQVVSAVVGQLGAAGGGTLPIPTELSPSILTHVLNQVTGVLNTVFNGIMGGGVGGVCTWLPFLC